MLRVTPRFATVPARPQRRIGRTFDHRFGARMSSHGRSTDAGIILEPADNAAVQLNEAETSSRIA